jgi:hypothetical protein
MKTQIERIEYFINNFHKVVSSHGADSDYAIIAFFQMRAAINGKSEKEIFAWADAEFERQKKLTTEAE